MYVVGSQLTPSVHEGEQKSGRNGAGQDFLEVGPFFPFKAPQLLQFDRLIYLQIYLLNH